MAEIRNPFNPERFRGKNGLLTVEEASRLQDLIKGAGDTYTRVLNKILQQFNVDITNVVTTPGPDGSMGIPGLDGIDGEDGARGIPGRDGARGRDGVAGQDGADGEDAMLIPGSRGPAGRDGLMMAIEVPADEGEHLFVPPGAPAADRVSFHFYIDDTATSGDLAPSSKVVVSPGVSTVYYSPAVGKVFRRGSLQANIITNGLVGAETYNISVQGSLAGAASASLTVNVGVTGLLTVEFTTGSTSPLETYVVTVSTSTAGARAITYTLVLRLFEA